ncbi:CynX/NimT family MFS transporter [Rhodohalobacter barkolensis]|uniref:MFS transporter n=1 Tax=Rhodohalobacter barkolensis TaxID=2053187 RepID=A0A2N0VH59_9BACT|nr:MFS transporter [Rhodohalobacter barkolensis]PKD43535.1 MFS transporter [Rhodohalobacter barkolensis]
MSPEQNRKILLITAIAVIAFNLRPAIGAVGPLIYEIRLDTGLSNTLLGMLTTLPVLAFGIFSILTPFFTKKMGTEGTMTLALILLTAGLLIRIYPAHTALFAGTAVLGVGIALANVLLPGIVKKSFPNRYGLVTGIYSAMLGTGAAISSGISVPLSEGLNFGWRWSLGFWAAMSFIALLIWLPQMRKNIPVIANRSFRSALKHLTTSGIALNVALFMGLQSLTFFIIVAWLPEILIERGMETARAGLMLAIVQGSGVLGTFLMPAWASRRQRQRLPVGILVGLEVISLLGLIFITDTTYTEFWASLLGISLGGCFGMALLFIVLRTKDSETANELSGMAQSAGYTLAAIGPALFGGLHDLIGNWTTPLMFLLIVSILKFWSGWISGRSEYI